MNQDWQEAAQRIATGPTYDELRQQLTAVTAERDRLREALQQIADEVWCKHSEDVDHIRWLAEDALAATSPVPEGTTRQ